MNVFILNFLLNVNLRIILNKKKKIVTKYNKVSNAIIYG